MRLLEAGRGRASWSVYDVVGFVGGYAAGDFVKTGLVAHAISDRMIGAGAVAADAQTSDDLATLIESNAAAEGDDAPTNWLAPDRGDRNSGLNGLELLRPYSEPPGCVGA
jgi:hypothetical protein